jgi:hypothetical protein
VISHGFWKRGFASAPAAVGRTLRLRGGSVGNSGTSGLRARALTGRATHVASIVGGAA